MTQRKRYNGSAQSLLDALEPFYPFPGAIKYSEDKNPLLDRAALQKDPLKGLLTSLHKLQENLSFNKKTVEIALGALADKHWPTWRLSDEEKVSWGLAPFVFATHVGMQGRASSNRGKRHG